MSNTPYPEDTASFPQAGPSKEEPDIGMSDLDCHLCRNFRLPDPRLMNTTYAELQRTATGGCWLCKLLRKVSERAFDGTNKVIQDTDVVHLTPGLSGVNGRPACLKVRRDYLIYPKLFYAASGDSCPWPFMTSDYIPDENASIQDCAQRIDRMLDTCNTTHTTCKAGGLQQISGGLVTPQFIPKRLLHISSDYVSLQVRLHETTSGETSLKGAGLRYTALSHCWGSTPPIKTTTVTMSVFKNEGIRWECLSKSFQEAILLTRELGINYIWIDSLCILQDSVSDWAHEASQMARLFSNSYLTIGASAAENGHQGLLNRRQRTTRISGAIHDGKATAVFVRGSIWNEFVENGFKPFTDSSDLPLRKRAWCFQEELLSVRMIHFTQDEIVFVCREVTTCECDPKWHPRFNLPPIIGTSQYHTKPFEIWENIVEHYTERQISFCKDRLPALSSLTHFFEEGSGRYLAGLWESYLPGRLLWLARCGRRPEQEQHSQCSPPSWSWASIEGAVNHQQDSEGTHKDVAEVLEVRTYPSTGDPRGMVSGGQITLRAPLFPLRGTWGKHESSWQRFLEWYSDDISVGSGFSCNPGWALNFPWIEDDCFCVLDDPTNPRLLLPNRIIDTTVFLLIIRTLDSNHHSEAFRPGGYRFLGLLLQPLDDLDQTQARTMEDSGSKLSFVRIGIGGMCLSEEHGEEALQRFGNTIVTIF